MSYQLPLLRSDNRTLELAFRAAIGDLLGNIQPWTDARGVTRSCLLAGLHYNRPWTRDAAINSWNGVSLLWPSLARNTLESVLIQDAYGLRIGGQYWDAIIWVTGAWNHFLVSGDREFLERSFSAAQTSLRYLDSRELDHADNLYRGGSSDGIAGYPDAYLNPDWNSGIAGWPERHPDARHPNGEGFPAKTLSTNLLYRNAWRLLPEMAAALGLQEEAEWAMRAGALTQAIREAFWDQSTGRLRYLVDPWGGCERQEGLGWAFAVLFGLLSAEESATLQAGAHTTPHGIPSLWPDYERYAAASGPGCYGRHGPTVWPQVNAFWADACSLAGAREAGWRELTLLAEKADRDGHFAEIYHPDTGERYGGEQEATDVAAIRSWRSEPRQSWCASGFVRMVTSVLFGMRPAADGLRFDPWLPDGTDRISLHGLSYHGRPLDLELRREAADHVALTVNGAPWDGRPFGSRGVTPPSP
jgi:glycogen debranching enzyme